MKGYSLQSIPENCARARLEGVNASYKELAEVCGRIRNKKTDWAVEFLQQVSEGGIPVLFKRHNRNMGHRHEVGGRKGRYPKKAAHYVLKTLKSAIANGKTLGLGESYTILTALANKKDVYPRLAPKGRQSRSYLETARIEIVLKGEEIPKGVTVTPPKKPEKRPRNHRKRRK
jgi:large subunit ribosomal protein L22